MNVNQSLTGIDRARLDSLLDFWTDDRHQWPVSESDRRDLLRQRMSENEVVSSRVQELSSRLRDLLRHTIRELNWRDAVDFKKVPEADLPVESFEVTAVLTALAERGFFVGSGRRGGSQPTRWRVPDELGLALEAVFDASQRPVEASFSLRRYLRQVDRTGLRERLEALNLDEMIELTTTELRERLVEQDIVESRLEHVADPELRRLLDMTIEHGGVFDAAFCRNRGVDVDVARMRAWGEELERVLMGSFESRELVNQGLGVGEGWIIVFHEVAEVLLDRGLSGDEERLSAVETAPDGFADLRGLIRGLEESPFKVRKGGEYFKTGIRRLAKEALSPGYRPEGAEADVLFLLSLLDDLDLIRRNGDGRVIPANGWRDWLKKSATERGDEVLRWSRRSGNEKISSLHLSSMRRRVFDILAERGIGAWLSVDHLVGAARNAHLAEAARPEYALRYQDRHKRHPFPPLAAPELLRRSLDRWLSAAPWRLGLVELAWRDEETRPFAVRLSAFGGRVLGLEIEEETEGVGLIVNSDFELILFPENTGYEVIQEIGRFAERIKADYAIHYRLTRESVQAAVALDFGEQQILELLEQHASHDLPANVVESMSEWCRRTLKLASRRSWIVEAPDKESLRRALDVPELKSIVRSHLGPLVLELSDDPTSSGAASALRDRGIHLSF